MKTLKELSRPGIIFVRTPISAPLVRTSKGDDPIRTDAAFGSATRSTGSLERLTVTIDEDLVAEVNGFMTQRGYANRSEAFRDLLRSGLEQLGKTTANNRPCIATLSYIYDHADRELPKRLTKEFHDHHNLAQATLNIHIDHDSCLEVTVLEGRGSEVQKFAEHVMAERGVRYGHVAVMPIDTQSPSDRKR